MTDSPTIDQDIEQLSAIVARANSEIADGAVIDMAPLESAVQAVCTRIGGLPPDQGAGYRAGLVALLDDLGSLQRKVELGLEALAGELGDSAKRRQAVSAYGPGHGTPPGTSK